MRKLKWKKIITLSLCLALLASLSTKFVFADNELTKFDNFKKVQSYKEGTFTDVKEDDWFHDNVVNLYELKLMIGMSENFFDTENNLKVCEAMALAARLNATYEGSILPEQGEGKKWYLPYVTYLKEKEIVNPDDYNLESAITRREFAEIFSRCLPEEAFEEINNVKDGMIPDVKDEDKNKEAIFKLFKSGVLTGMDETRSFEPDRTIKRSEASAVVSRIVNPKLRIDLHLPKDEPVVPAVPEKKPSGGGSSGGGGGGSNPPAPQNDYSTMPLTITMLNDTPNTKLKFVEHNNPTIPMEVSYKVNDGEWTNYTFGDEIPLSKDTKVSFRATNKLDSLTYPGNDYRCFEIDDDNDSSTETEARVEVSGNIMSLIDPDLTVKNLSAKNGSNEELFSYAFIDLFYECSALYKADNLVLPADELAEGCYTGLFQICSQLKYAPSLPARTLAEGCYDSMFSGCKSLETAPSLPATTAAEGCYQWMFEECTSLKTAPELPATTLAKECYFSMFTGCTSLSVAPSLPARTLAESCYGFMFEDCTSLETVPELPASSLAKGCYKFMFYKCTSLETAPELPATTLAKGCYEYMFENCTSLKTAPELPATTLADYCYEYMFRNCTGILYAPKLPATTLAEGCYKGMFWNCDHLREVYAAFDEFNETDCTTSWLSGSNVDLTLYCTKAYYDSIKDNRSADTVPENVTIKLLPEKGDLIYLDGQPELYEVLSRDGLNVEVMSSEISNMKFYDNDQNVPLGLFSDGNNYPLYAGSIVDKFLNGDNEGDFYHGLSSNIKNAIVEKDVVQTALMASDTNPGEYLFDGNGFYIYEIGNKEVGKRNVYTISLEDVAKLIESNIFDLDTIFDALTFVNAPTWLLNAINSYQGNLLLSLDFILHAGYIDGSDNIGVIPTFTVNITKVDYEIYDPEKEYMYVMSNSNGTQVMLRSSYNKTPLPLEWSKDLTNWTPVDYYEEQREYWGDYANGEAIALDSGEKVYFRKIAGETLPAELGNTFFYFTDDDAEDSDPSTNSAEIVLGGNIMSLIDETLELKDLTGIDNVFYYMFAYNDALEVRADKLILPATTLSEWCYYYMFFKCIHLISAPELPAMNLADYCYYFMFGYCEDLVSAPDLPAPTLKECCYCSMFANCISLIDPPVMSAETMAYSSCGSMFSGCSSLTYGIELPAMTLATECYESMYYHCTNLLDAPELPATTLAEGCYRTMFLGCESLEETPTLPATTLANTCYYGMFGGCESLKNLDVSFTAFDTTNYSTYGWLDGVTGPVTVTCYYALKESGYAPSVDTFPDGTLFVLK